LEGSAELQVVEVLSQTALHYTILHYTKLN